MNKSELMNFRIPIDTKRQFLKICKYHNISMTSRLNVMIKEFIMIEEKFANDSNHIFKKHNEPMQIYKNDDWR